MLLAEHDAMLDELVFEAVYAALRECGLRKQDLGLSVLASMDVLDGRSISSGLTNSAAGGYLGDSFRVEGDAGLAVLSAAQAVASGDVEVAVAVGVHNPETSGSPAARRAFVEQVSNLGFEPHFDRPIGLTANIVYALHAAHRLSSPGQTVADWADLAAAEITRGATRPRTARGTAVGRQDVLSSAAVAWPLHELMLPADSTGAVAVILASPARAGRCLGRDARLTGLGHATGGYTWSGEWLSDPAATTRRAADMAFAQAGLRAEDITLAEVSAPTPALHQPYLNALSLSAAASVNASGGVRSNFPGLANGALRLLEVVEQLAPCPAGTSAVSHSVDTETGVVSEDVTVLVVEAA
jgi:acetyl-CoA acetyltransferase